MSTSPPIRRLAPRDAVWAEDWLSAAAAQPEEVLRRWLRDLLVGRPTGRERRAACVCACATVLDLADPRHVELLREVVRDLVPISDRAQRLVDRILRESDEPDLRRQALMQRAIGRAMRSDYEVAVPLFRRLVAGTRGEGSEFELRALVNWATCHRNRGRYFEALLVGGQAVRLARRLGVRRALGFALLVRANALEALAEWDAAEEALAEAARIADEDGLADLVGAARRTQLSSRLYRTDKDGAVRALEELGDDDVTGGHEYHAAYRLVARVDVLMRGDDVEAAREALLELQGRTGRWFQIDLATVGLTAEIEVRTGSAGVAATWIARNLELLREAGRRGVGWSRVVDRARRMVSAARRIGDDALAHAALDLAATASLERMRELDGILSGGPEDAPIDELDRRRLARFRARYLQENEELCRLVVERIRLGEDDVARWARKRLRNADGTTLICAWCRLLRDDRGAWLPIGHLLSNSGAGELRVTHGICASCETDVRGG